MSTRKNEKAEFEKFIKSEMKSRAAGAGFFDRLGINSNAPVAHKPAAESFLSFDPF